MEVSGNAGVRRFLFGVHGTPIQIFASERDIAEALITHWPNVAERRPDKNVLESWHASVPLLGVHG